MSIKIKYLTDSKIRSLPIQNKEALFVCSPKLYVRVHPNGSKYFEYRYTFHKKQRTKRIGVYMVQSHWLKPVQRLKNTMGWSERT